MVKALSTFTPIDNWANKPVTNPQKEKTVTIVPYKPMTESEYDAIKAEKAADRAFKVQELTTQAKKMGIPENYLFLISDEPENCKINRFNNTFIHENDQGKRELSCKNGKLNKEVYTYNEYGLNKKIVTDLSTRNGDDGYWTSSEYTQNSDGKYELTSKKKWALLGDSEFKGVEIVESWYYDGAGKLKEHNKYY